MKRTLMRKIVSLVTLACLTLMLVIPASAADDKLTMYKLLTQERENSQWVVMNNFMWCADTRTPDDGIRVHENLKLIPGQAATDVVPAHGFQVGYLAEGDEPYGFFSSGEPIKFNFKFDKMMPADSWIALCFNFQAQWIGNYWEGAKYALKIESDKVSLTKWNSKGEIFLGTMESNPFELGKPLNIEFLTVTNEAEDEVKVKVKFDGETAFDVTDKPSADKGEVAPSPGYFFIHSQSAAVDFTLSPDPSEKPAETVTTTGAATDATTAAPTDSTTDGEHGTTNTTNTTVADVKTGVAGASALPLVLIAAAGTTIAVLTLKRKNRA